MDRFSLYLEKISIDISDQFDRLQDTLKTTMIKITLGLKLSCSNIKYVQRN